MAFTTSRGEKWVFWLSYRTGSFDIWYRRNFGNEIQLNTGTGYVNWNYRVIEDSHGDIWVFWQSNSGLYYKHYNGTWGFTTQLTADHFDYFSITESHTSDIWTFRVQNNRDIQYQQLVAAI